MNEVELDHAGSRKAQVYQGALTKVSKSSLLLEKCWKEWLFGLIFDRKSPRHLLTFFILFHTFLSNL